MVSNGAGTGLSCAVVEIVTDVVLLADGTEGWQARSRVSERAKKDHDG
jgi:hypothetical protein